MSKKKLIHFYAQMGSSLESEVKCIQNSKIPKSSIKTNTKWKEQYSDNDDKFYV